MEILANLGVFSLQGQAAQVVERKTQVLKVRSILRFGRQSQTYCEINPADCWFLTPPAGVVSLPVAPAVTVNTNPLPANAVALPSDFDVDDPDFCRLFQDILPVDSPPVYPSQQSFSEIAKPYYEIIKADGIVRSTFEVTKIDYSLNAGIFDVKLKLRPVLQLVKDLISGNAGAYVYTGNNAELTYTKRLVGSAGVFILGRTIPSYFRNYAIGAGAGGLGLTGGETVLELGHLLAAESASFVLNSGTALFPIKLTGSAGSFAVSGSPAELVTGVIFELESRQFAITGQAIELVYSRSPLTAETGSYLLNQTVAQAELTYFIKFDASVGSYTLTSEQGRLVRSYVIDAITGIYSLSDTGATRFTYPRFFSSWISQNYGWDVDLRPDWWAE